VASVGNKNPKFRFRGGCTLSEYFPSSYSMFPTTLGS